jgi:hypothetical protein
VEAHMGLSKDDGCWFLHTEDYKCNLIEKVGAKKSDHVLFSCLGYMKKVAPADPVQLKQKTGKKI